MPFILESQVQWQTDECLCWEWLLRSSQEFEVIGEHYWVVVCAQCLAVDSCYFNFCCSSKLTITLG